MEQTPSTKGHPKGLYVLFATEFWERFSYYGMRAIFVLYMTKALLLDKALASNIYGSYTGLVYLTPLIGGYVADRYWGNRRSIFVGGILMALGQFLMFFSATLASGDDKGFAITMMWSGLAFLIFGNGFFKPNISTMVGQLYVDTDNRKDAAYTIFYMGINAGAFFAPLICGYLGENVDYKWGFLAAGVGMLVSMVIFYLTKDKYVIAPDGRQLGVGPNKAIESTLGGDEETGLDAASTDKKKNGKSGGFSVQQLLILVGGIVATFSILDFVFGIDVWGSLIYGMTLVGPLVIITDKSLTKVEKDRLWVIILIMIFVIFFWMCFEQAGASLTFFAAEQTNRKIFGWEMPASYFQSFNALFIVILAPIISAMWVRLAKKNISPAAPYKQSIGLAFLALGFLLIAFGSKSIPASGASIFFLTGLYFLHTIGELFLSPIGLSMVNKLTPGRFTSLMMGIWFLAIATGNKLAGTMSSLYPEDVKTVGVVSLTHNVKEIKTNADLTKLNVVTSEDSLNQYDLTSGKIVKLPVAGNTDGISEMLHPIDKIDPFKLRLSTRQEEGKLTYNFRTDVYKTSDKYLDVTVSYDKDLKMNPVQASVVKLYATKDASKLIVYKTAPDGKDQSVEVWDMTPKKPVLFGIKIDNLHSYFMLFVGFSGVAALLLFLLCRKLQKMMHGVR